MSRCEISFLILSVRRHTISGNIDSIIIIDYFYDCFLFSGIVRPLSGWNIIKLVASGGFPWSHPAFRRW
jgi:hypothetical protein